MLLISSPQFARHITPPGHPERPERGYVFESVAREWVQKGGRALAPRVATMEELERVHTQAHIAAIEATAGRATMLDADTFTSPDSAAVARLAAGAAVQAVEEALTSGEPVFALVRPPGHHAEPDRPMGFCLYNNVAVGAAAALARGIERVAVVDIDVHHGNGTQQMFYDDPRVLYVSTHQHPFYPGTGAAEEVGVGTGAGFTVNVPMEAGSGDSDYALVHRRVVGPILEAFAPQLLLVSAGFDAHERDPLGSMRLSTAGYQRTVGGLIERTPRDCATVLVTEGGYDLPALEACVNATLAAFEQGRTPGGHAAAGEPLAAERGERAVASSAAALSRYWRLP